MNCDCELWKVLPELTIFSAGLFVLLAGLFFKSKNFLIALNVMFSILIIYVLWFDLSNKDALILGGLYSSDVFSKIAKLILVSLVSIIFLISRDLLRLAEYFALLWMATLGMFLALSANDLILLYLGLELQALALYILITVERDINRVLDAGVRYFVLSSVTSAMMIYGMSLIYGFCGTSSFSELAMLNLADQFPVLVGVSLMICGVLFKISAVPFHIWVPDVYRGAPLEMTIILATMSKFTGVLILIRMLIQPLQSLDINYLIPCLAICSVLLGSLGAMKQRNIKRFMAYSSIAHIGYVLLALNTCTQAGYVASVLYMLIYLISSTGVFVILMYVNKDCDKDVENCHTFQELSMRIASNPFLIFAMTIFMLSMAGLPPMAGFFAKFYVFASMIKSGMFALATLAILAGVLSIAYYLRIVKVLCFEKVDASCALKNQPFFLIVIFISVILNLIFFVNPNYVQNIARLMIESL